MGNALMCFAMLCAVQCYAVLCALLCAMCCAVLCCAVPCCLDVLCCAVGRKLKCLGEGAKEPLLPPPSPPLLGALFGPVPKSASLNNFRPRIFVDNNFINHLVHTNFCPPLVVKLFFGWGSRLWGGGGLQGVVQCGAGFRVTAVHS